MREREQLCRLCGAKAAYSGGTLRYEYPCGHEGIVNALWGQALKEGGDKFNDIDKVNVIFQNLLEQKRIEIATAPLLARVAKLEGRFEQLAHYAKDTACDCAFVMIVEEIAKGAMKGKSE